MIELVINCGSSSLKYTVFDMPEGTELCNGIFAQLGTSLPEFTHKKPDENGKSVKLIDKEMLPPMSDHTDAIKKLVATMFFVYQLSQY